MTLRVGSAVADLTINISPARTAITTFRAEMQRFRRELEVPIKIPAPQVPTIPTPRQSAVPGANAPSPRQPTQQQQDRQILALANAQARAASATGNHEKAASLLQTALRKVDSTSVAAINTQTRLYQTIQKISAAKGPQQLSKDLTDVDRSARAAQGGLGLLSKVAAGAFVAKQVADYAVGVRDLALRTQQSDNSLRILAGTTERYNEALTAARRQQSLFGGSLQENIDGITGLVTVSRSAGVGLQSLIDVSQQLAVKDPSQGVVGARIALQEALSGDPTSLARRYEIPRKALAALRDESTTGAEKIKLISDYLTGIGIAADSAAKSVPTAAQELNTLGATAEAVQLKLGGLIAEGFRPFVREATKGFQDIANALTKGDVFAGLQADVLKGAQSFDAFAAAEARAYQQAGLGKDPVLAAALGVKTLTQEQFNYAKALTARGIGEQEAIQRTQALADVLAEAANGQRAYAATVDENTAAYDRIAERLVNVAAVGDASARATVQALLIQKPPLADLEVATRQLEQAQQAQAKAADDAAIEGIRLARANEQTRDASTEAGKAIADELEKKQASTFATNELAGAQQLLAQLGGAVAAGHQTAGQAAILLASRYGIAVSEAERLINAQTQLARTGAAPMPGQKLTYQQQRDLREERNANAGGQGPVSGAVDAYVKQKQAQAKAAQEAREAERQYQEAVKTTAQKLKDAQADVAKAAAGSKEYYDAKRREFELQQQLNSERQRGAKSAAASDNKGLTALDKDAIKLNDDLQGQLDEVNRQLERGNLTQHQRNQLLIQQRDLEQKILDLKRDQAKAAVDAALAANQDAQKRIEEARLLRGLDEQAKNAKATEEEREAARLKAEEIRLTQAQRALDIQEKVTKASGAEPIPTAQQTPQDANEAARRQNEEQQRRIREGGQAIPPPPATPTLPPAVPTLTLPPGVLSAPPVSVTINLNVQGDRLTSADVDGDAILNLIVNGTRASNLIGGKAP